MIPIYMVDAKSIRSLYSEKMFFLLFFLLCCYTTFHNIFASFFNDSSFQKSYEWNNTSYVF